MPVEQGTLHDTIQKTRSAARTVLSGVSEGLTDGNSSTAAGVPASAILEQTPLQVLAQEDPAAVATQAAIQFLKSGRVSDPLKEAIGKIGETLDVSGPVLKFVAEGGQ
ncbi:MAG: hypothetical protein HYV40_01935 [Candidatus Levybacteria bacterium]|nr:hypothetical protein [Candidatus Levybacteria bacterium]